MAPPPSVSVSLELSTYSFSQGEEVDLSIIATSHASSPITIFTWPTIFNASLALKRKNFECLDLDTNTPLRLEITKGGKRAGFSFKRGSADEEYCYTLMPEEPIKFTSPFKIINYRGIIPGHRYRFGVHQGEKLEWWAAATKDEVFEASGEPGGRTMYDEEPIELTGINDIEFEIKPAEA
jgi:hypothetical protein